MLSVKIDKSYLIALLLDRVNFWTYALDEEELSLYTSYFQNEVRGGGFEDIELDIMSIVDNFIHNDSQIFFKKDFKGDLSKVLLESENYFLVTRS